MGLVPLHELNGEYLQVIVVTDRDKWQLFEAFETFGDSFKLKKSWNARTMNINVQQ